MKNRVVNRIGQALLPSLDPVVSLPARSRHEAAPGLEFPCSPPTGLPGDRATADNPGLSSARATQGPPHALVSYGGK
jgi:hypothetical protein